MNERDRVLRKMHIHFARGVWRWLLDPESWEAEMHMKFAVQFLEEANFELEPSRGRGARAESQSVASQRRARGAAAAPSPVQK